ncbi:flagellar basal body L-ring protein FlgH [Granulicella tundricola]|uniref:Flagellar L-ring protein n=1 Tax=Granulicella tundricola (strain ATCC BAA-1859 / DSM 23138 / MP5ACTX9) TaxID=1198114 RepID=E8X3V4_GRATM|nr:flagellar basal body L-ring protein FlgH [Granulicella tundricola]ADW69382.1 flagellar L-ring protein [Granulicella tundricola MP5ACTX9]
MTTMSVAAEEREMKSGELRQLAGGSHPPVLRFAMLTCGVLLLLLAVSLQAQTVATAAAAPASTQAGKKGLIDRLKPVEKPNVAQSSIATYLARVKADGSTGSASEGSIWSENGRLAHLSTDVRAMRPHDLISVVVSESLAASTDGEVKNSRASNANSQISAFFGLLHAGNAMQNLLNQSSTSGLAAQGASATNSSLSTTFGGQVIDVLPNGMLVIEAARQVEFSQQTQTIVLRGLVRPEDISQQNQVLSTAISSLELEVRGKGIVNDFTHRQNALVRLLEKVLVF